MEICEKLSSELSPLRQPLEITLPIIEEDKNDTTRPNEAASSSSVIVRFSWHITQSYQ